jgi:transcriptional regulator with XRE-family HTH domain
MKIGTALKKIREEKGISQIELCSKVGISQTSLSQIENGVKRPSSKNLAKLCACLDIPEPILYLYAIEISDVPDKKRESFKIIFPAIEDMLNKVFVSEKK